MKNTTRLISLCLVLLCLQGSMFDGALLAQDGALDPTFNPRSVSGAATFRPGFDGRDLIRQSDGKLLVAVNANGLSVMRLNANGSVDSAFGTNGVATNTSGTLAETRSVALQSDGKILVAGQANPFGNDDFAIARFNANGSPDLTFSGDGIAVFGIATGANDIAYDLAVQADGKIVAVGTTSANGTDWAMIRLNADGTLDGSFTNGQITQTTGNDGLYTIKLQSDGKIVVAGYVLQSSEQRLALGRFSASGVRDSTFNGNGVKIDDIGTGAQNYNDIQIQSDGKIVAAGAISFNATAGGAIVGRYNANGTNDTSFSADGFVAFTAFESRQAFASLGIQGDGKIVCGGYLGKTTDVNDNFLVVRLLTNGALDSTFGTSGRSQTDFNAQTDQAFGLVLDASGKITLAGKGENFVGTTQIAVAQYNSNGTLDNAFAARTEASPNIKDFGIGNDEIRDIAAQSDGKIVAAGIRFGGNQDWAITRYNADGATDTTFGTDGGGATLLSLVSGANEVPTSIAVQSDNKILVAGYTVQSGTNRLALARFTANGALDNTFAGGQGFLISTISNSEAYDVLALPNGKILVAGWVNDAADDFEVFQFNSDGTADIAFGSGGQVSIDFGGTSNEVAYALARQPDGKILVGGASNTAGGQFAVARLNTDGTLDNTFDTDGKRTIDIVSTGTNNDIIRSIVVQNDTKILLGGTAASTTNGISNNFALARLRSTGALDSTFGTNGQLVTDFNSREDVCLDIELLADGKILAIGYVIAPGGTTNASRNLGIARYLPNGALDNTFDGDGKAEIDAGGFTREDVGYTGLVQPSGRILVGGYSNRNNFDFALTGVRGSIAPAPFGYLPTGTTSAPTNVTTNTATLNGLINTNTTVLTDAKFAYGLNPNNLTDSVAVSPNLIGSITSGTAVSANITGLTQASRYYYRLVTRNAVGTSQSEIGTFFTKPTNSGTLRLWLRADFADTASGGAITTVRDGSGNNANAVQSNNSRRPALVNAASNFGGKPIMRYGNTGISTLSFPRRTNIRTVFMVAMSLDTTSLQFMLGDSVSFNFHGGSNTLFGASFSSPFINNGKLFYNASPRAVISTLRPLVPTIITVQTTGNVEASTLADDRPGNPATQNRSWRGDIAEVLIYSDSLSAQDRLAVETYLSQRYNIPLSTVSTKEREQTGVPKTFALEQNYPNPFNPTTTIGYDLPSASRVSLKVYDVLGREVATLVNARQAAGSYNAAFNAANFASGIYFYRLEAGSFVQTKKMLLVK